MSEFLGDLICGTRNLLIQGFRSLPVFLGSSLLFMGLTQGNLNMLFFFVGLFIVAPTASMIVNLLLEFVFKWLLDSDEGRAWWTVPFATAEQCTLFGTPVRGMESAIPGAVSVVPTYWMTIMAFFFTYLLSNASELMKKPTSDKADPTLVSARKSQAILSISIVSILLLVITVIRYLTSCETAIGMGIAWILGANLAILWFKFMRACGMGRLEDVFGITNMLLPRQSTDENAPVVCIQTK